MHVWLSDSRSFHVSIVMEKKGYGFGKEGRSCVIMCRHDAKELESNANRCRKDIHVCEDHRTELTGIIGIHF